MAPLQAWHVTVVGMAVSTIWFCACTVVNKKTEKNGQFFKKKVSAVVKNVFISDGDRLSEDERKDCCKEGDSIRKDIAAHQLL